MKTRNYYEDTIQNIHILLKFSAYLQARDEIPSDDLLEIPKITVRCFSSMEVGRLGRREANGKPRTAPRRKVIKLRGHTYNVISL